MIQQKPNFDKTIKFLLN